MRTFRVLWGLLAVAAALVIATVLVRMAEPRLAFFPLSGEGATPADAGVQYNAFNVATEDGEQLRVWHLPRRDALAQVVYFHGNGGNLSLWSDILVEIRRRGFDLVAVDYRGYGVSSGSPSERGLYRDVDATLRLVHGDLRRADVPLIYWGRSLGATMAAYAARTSAAAGVVLESGFPSARDVLASTPPLWALSWLSTYRFPTAEWMREVRAPVLVLHGDNDTVIAYRLGQRLYAQLSGPKQMFTIRGGDHNDATPRDAEGYWRTVESFARSLERPGTR